MVQRANWSGTVVLARLPGLTPPTQIDHYRARKRTLVMKSEYGHVVHGLPGSRVLATDGKLEIWLALCNEIDRWTMHQSGSEKHENIGIPKATAGFGGCVDAGLGQIVGSEPSRAAVLRDLGDRAIRRLRSTPTTSRQLLISYSVGGSASRWTADVEAEAVAPVAAAFDALLEGTLTSDAASSPASKTRPLRVRSIRACRVGRASSRQT